MCGIFAYCSFSCQKSIRDVLETITKGLKRLEYRGYDSAGLSVSGNGISNDFCCKSTGDVSGLCRKIELSNTDINQIMTSQVSIAHTRWATHGPPCETNCHPIRSDPRSEFLVVHNGMVTNSDQLRMDLVQKGYEFETETDTEAVAILTKCLFDESKDRRNFSFVKLIKLVLEKVEGLSSFVFKSRHFPCEVVAACCGKTLLIGLEPETKDQFVPVEFSSNEVCESGMSAVGNISNPTPLIIPPQNGSHSPASKLQNGLDNPVQYFIASDPCAVVEHTKRVVYLETGDVVHISRKGLKIHSLRQFGQFDGDRAIQELELEVDDIGKGGFDTFMQKEIFEQPESVRSTMLGRIDFQKHKVNICGLILHIPRILRGKRLVFFACGTSFHSCLATRSIFEKLTSFPVSIELANDFLDRGAPVYEGDICIFVSQSGETADTIAALKRCKEQNMFCISVVNVLGSFLYRESDFCVQINAGPEFSVASTKAYTSQCITLVMIALQLSEGREILRDRRYQIIDSLKELPEMIQEVLKLDKLIGTLANDIYQHHNLLLLGRGFQYAACLEGALKVTEISYISATGISAGELKHGPIAVIDENLPVIFIKMMKDSLHSKSLTDYCQITARNAQPIVICNTEDQSIRENTKAIRVPSTVDCLQGILTVITLQMSHHLGEKRKCNIDRPRNLAKSVTVE